MDPIIGMCQAVMNNELTNNGTPKAHNMAAAVGVHLPEEVKKTLTGKSLLKYILQQWLPLSEVVLEMIVIHLPSPAVAQEYRCETLCGISLSEEITTAVRACDSSERAPLVLYVSKLNFGWNGHYSAFGRVLSGKVRSGQKICIFDPQSTLDNKKTSRESLAITTTNKPPLTVQQAVVWTGNKATRVADISAGHLCGLIGSCDSTLTGIGIGSAFTAILLVEADR